MKTETTNATRPLWTITTTHADADRGESIVCPPEHANEGFIIARLYGPDREANARLIAAAPELLAELKSSYDDLALLITGRCPASLVQEIVNRMSAHSCAIAKAASS